MIQAATLSHKFKRAHLRILITGIVLILASSLYSTYSTEEIFAMFVKDRYQLIVVHVLFNILISVLIVFATWQVNKRILGNVFDRLNILTQLWFAMRFFWIFGLVSILAPLAFWLHTVLGQV
ncbi:MAG: hypothetical protein SGJ10_05615 [Bacteroidota bacterium]|nr:hypothetical protein [Bacteroidota bacterium]